MRKGSILAAAFSIWWAAGSAWGATASTSILRQAAGDGIECRVVNVGRSALQMTSEGVNPDGSVFGRQSARVDPGKEGPTIAGTCGAATGGFCAAYCRFTARSKKSMRGSITTVSASLQQATAALPAE
jgi:hypothetical protein